MKQKLLDYNIKPVKLKENNSVFKQIVNNSKKWTNIS